MVLVVRVHDVEAKAWWQMHVQAEGRARNRGSLLKLQNPPPVTHFLCNQLPTGDYAFKCLRLLRAISVKPLQQQKILISYFVAFPNFIRKDTRPRLDDMISKEEEEGRGGGRRKRKRRSCSNTDLPNFNMYYKVMKVKTVWYWWKNRQDKWKRIENLGMNPQKLII